MRKLAASWISFACSEDSSVLFVELYSRNFFDWKDKIEWKCCRMLKGKNNKIEGSDVVFVEGAIATKEDEEFLKEIRGKCKRIVAVGSCACTGFPSAQRNTFDEATNREIMHIVEKFGYLEKVHPVKDIVKVDYEVPGCPMDEGKFIEVLNKLFEEFGVV